MKITLIKFQFIFFCIFFYLAEYKLINIIQFLFDIYKISVIIPIYNSEQFLSQCLNSIINQSLKTIEIICVDDGSKDKSLLILKEYQKVDKRLKIFSQYNKGSGLARNKGIKYSKGKFIAFMDSDDLYPNNFILEILYKKASKYNVLICGGGLNEFDYINNTIKLRNKIDTFTFKKEGIYIYANYQFDYGYYRFIYNKRFIKKNKIYFPNYIRYQDPPFFIKAMALSTKFYAIKEITYYYRISHKIWNEKKIIDQYKGFIYSLKLCEKFSLNKLYYTILSRLNTDLFILPTKKYIKNQKLRNIIEFLIKNINYNLIKEKNFIIELNNFKSILNISIPNPNKF